MCLICIHVTAKDLSVILSLSGRPKRHTLHTIHTICRHTSHTIHTANRHTLHTSMFGRALLLTIDPSTGGEKGGKRAWVTVECDRRKLSVGKLSWIRIGFPLTFAIATTRPTPPKEGGDGPPEGLRPYCRGNIVKMPLSLCHTPHTSMTQEVWSAKRKNLSVSGADFRRSETPD